MEAEKNKVEIVVYENNTEATDRTKLRRFNRLCKILEDKNVSIKRYSYVEGHEQCRQNKDLWYLIHCAGIDMLPATYINGKIEKIEEYPTKKEIHGWLSGTP